MRRSSQAPRGDHNLFLERAICRAAMAPTSVLTVASHDLIHHRRVWYRPGAPEPPPSHEARAPMYTRRSRLPFARRGPATALALLLVGCHSSQSGPALRSPSPTAVQVGYGTQ